MAKVRYRGDQPVELPHFGRALKKGDTLEVPDDLISLDGTGEGWHFAEPLWSVVDAPTRKTPTKSEKPPAPAAGSTTAKGEK